MKEKIKGWALIASGITIALLLLFRGCPNKVIKQTVNSTYKVDSIVHDTVRTPDKQITFNPIVKPKEKTVIPTIGIDSAISKETRIYNDSVFKDNVIISYKANVIGKLNSIDLSAKLINQFELKTTEYITRTDTIYKPTKFSLYGGIGLKSSFDIMPTITLNLNKVGISTGYYILNQEVELKITRKIWNSKK